MGRADRGSRDENASARSPSRRSGHPRYDGGVKIAIVGPGSIGSTFAMYLSRAGHDVTVVARGARLAQLERDKAIVPVSGEPAPVAVSAALDPVVSWDLVLVTVLATQVDAVLPAIQASAAKRVMFMFNTFEALDRLRDAVGAARFAWGFPAVLATLTEGKLKTQVFRVPQITTVTDAAWSDVFNRAGIPTVVVDDMQSWLRTHAAMIAPMMAAAARTHARGAGLSWAEARELARAMAEGFQIVRALGGTITPKAMVRLRAVPTPVVTFVLWAFTRLPMAAELGASGPGEARSLIDAMIAAAPDQSATLRAIRP